MKRVPRCLVPLVFGAVAALVSSAGCQEDETPCARAPSGNVTVFLEGEVPAKSFTAAVVEIEPPSESGLRRHRLREADGTERVLVFRAPEDSLPVRTDATYDFLVETVPGMPTPAAVVVGDEGGILFAAVSDYRPGERVLQEGLAGFSIELVPSGCEDRGVDPCFESEVNAVLSVEHADTTARLFQGESLTLGDYRVRCLTARTVAYSDRCADAGVFGISYTVRRME